MTKTFFCVFSMILGASLFALELKDPAFASFKDGKSNVWQNGCNAPVKTEESTLVVTASSTKLHDGIFQGVRLNADNIGKTYAFSAEIEAPVARKAYLQIKFYKGKSEIKRFQSYSAPAGKSTLFVLGSHPDADIIQVSMRIANGEGKEFKFSNPTLSTAGPGELYGNWLAVGPGFTVTDKKANSFTITPTQEAKQHAAVLLFKSVTPGKKMVFSADISGENSGGYLEVKLHENKKMIARKNNIGSPNHGVLEFETGSANNVILHCRIPVSKKYIGKSVTFSNIKLTEAE